MVLMSMITVPRFIAVNTPSGPASTSRTSGESGTMVTITSHCPATSAGDAAARAPAATSASTGPRLRLCTTRGNPALSRFSAIGFPIKPSPMNPTVVFTRPPRAGAAPLSPPP